MPKVHHVKKARKDNKKAGIKKGESYYWWAFRVGRGSIKRYSKTPPRPSQLTNSEYMSSFLSLQEEIEDEAQGVKTKEDAESLAQFMRDKAEEYRTLGDEQQEKFDNMPEGLQSGDTGQLLECRKEACDRGAEELESAADELENDPEVENWADRVSEVLMMISFEPEG